MAMREIPDNQWAAIQQAIADLTTSNRKFPMSKAGSGLARLVGGLKDLDGQANGLADQLEVAMKGLASEMEVTKQIVGNVQQSVTDLQSVNAMYSNGTAPTTGS